MNTKTLKYILKRIILAVVTIWIIITITFFAMHAIPGGPFLSEKAITAEAQAALEAKFGLDKPLGVQYLNYLKGVLTFDFGPSIKQRGRMVIDIILDGFKVSGKLGLEAPANGTTAAGLILPVITLMLYPMSYVTRLTRSSMLDVLGQDYIRTARAKGVSRRSMIYKHSLKNACIPVLTYAGPEIAYIVTGSLVVEQIFAVPGIGRSFVKSITDRDYTMIMGTTIFLATLIIVMTLLTDILYKIVDPRIDFS